MKTLIGTVSIFLVICSMIILPIIVGVFTSNLFITFVATIFIVKYGFEISFKIFDWATY